MGKAKLKATNVYGDYRTRRPCEGVLDPISSKIKGQSLGIKDYAETALTGRADQDSGYQESEFEVSKIFQIPDIV